MRNNHRNLEAIMAGIYFHILVWKFESCDEHRRRAGAAFRRLVVAVGDKKDAAQEWRIYNFLRSNGRPTAW